MEFIQQKQINANATGLSGETLNQTLPIEQNLKPSNKEGLGTKLDRLTEVLIKDKMSKDTKDKVKKWKFPFKWKMTMNKSTKSSSEEKVLCFFINKKSELDPPVLLPIYNGNTLVYKYTIHEIDPRDILTLHIKKKSYKLLIYRLMDRKAVSNRDYGEVRVRGDSTLDDEVFIKAMLTAKASQITKAQMSKGVLIVVGLIIAGAVIWFFSKS